MAPLFDKLKLKDSIHHKFPRIVFRSCHRKTAAVYYLEKSSNCYKRSNQTCCTTHSRHHHGAAYIPPEHKEKATRTIKRMLEKRVSNADHHGTQATATHIQSSCEVNKSCYKHNGARTLVTSPQAAGKELRGKSVHPILTRQWVHRTQSMT